MLTTISALSGVIVLAGMATLCSVQSYAIGLNIQQKCNIMDSISAYIIKNIKK